MAALEKLFQETYCPTDQRKCVGNYVIGPILGQGRSSLVRRAVDMRDGQRVSDCMCEGEGGGDQFLLGKLLCGVTVNTFVRL